MGKHAMTSPAAVFLDRDGVLNRAIVRNGKPYPPANIDELEIVPDAAAALSRLRGAGYLLIVATNQPDVGRGTTAKAAVDRINERLRATLPLDAVEMCIHDNADQCSCRKPMPGMLLQAAERFGIDLSRSYMIGDRWRDIEAGKAAGCRTALIGEGYAEGLKSLPDAIVGTLTEAVDWILNEAERTMRA
jgi:D-glycero-D-manno-heptose 1,7-bisphosphate phosphatase